MAILLDWQNFSIDKISTIIFFYVWPSHGSKIKNEKKKFKNHLRTTKQHTEQVYLNKTNKSFYTPIYTSNHPIHPIFQTIDDLRCIQLVTNVAVHKLVYSWRSKHKPSSITVYTYTKLLGRFTNR